MSKKNILVGDDDNKIIHFFTDFFADTKSIPIFCRSKEDLAQGFQMKPELIFMKTDWLDNEVKESLSEYSGTNERTKCFAIGQHKGADVKWDGVVELPLDPKIFRQILFSVITSPKHIKLLIIDDEQGVLDLFKDFFENRKEPEFEVQTAKDGLEGYNKIESFKPDCLILDVKMPVRSGIEVYADMYKKGIKIPTIIFIDSTSPDEISKIRKYGVPAFVEKAGPSSAMNEMLALIKKLLIFS